MAVIWGGRGSGVDVLSISPRWCCKMAYSFATSLGIPSLITNVVRRVGSRKLLMYRRIIQPLRFQQAFSAESLFWGQSEHRSNEVHKVSLLAIIFEFRIVDEAL